MKSINRNRFFTYLVSSLGGVVFFRNLFFSGLTKKRIEDLSIKVQPNPLSVSRNKSGVNNVR